MSVNLIAPDRSAFVNHVSECFDRNWSINNQISSLGARLFRAPRSIEGLEISDHKDKNNNLTNRDIVLYDVLLKNLHNFPADPQSVILKQANGLQSWIVSKMYCKDEAVNQFAISVLKDLNISFFLCDPTEVLLGHIFKELTVNLQKSEVEEILNTYRDEAEAIEQTKGKAQVIAEKVLSAASTVLYILAIPASIGVGCLIYEKGHDLLDYVKVEYLPILVNKIINNVPSKMILIATTIYEWKTLISFTFFVVSCTRLNNYAFIRIPMTVIKEILYLPATILGLPARFGYSIFWKAYDTTHKTAAFMYEGSTLIESIRRARELQHAETLWINQTKALKVSATAT